MGLNMMVLVFGKVLVVGMGEIDEEWGFVVVGCVN